MTSQDLKRAVGRVVLDRGPHAIAVMDPAGRVRYINSKFASISGWDENEVEGMPMERLLWSWGAQLEEIWSQVETGREWRGELWGKTKSGVQYREHASITPVKGASGRTVLLLLVSTARDRAERETRSRFEYLTDMSHELRTPIHAIIGNTELLSETKLNEEQKEYADTVRLSADILLTLINDVLDFSKIESGRLELEKIPFDVYEVVEEAVGLVALQAHTKGLEIITRFACGLSHLVEGDPLRLRQVLVNLLNNAVKFTRAGEVEVSVSQEKLESRDVVIRFRVRDTGIGIPQDRQDSLFKAFSQIDTSTTRTFGGTGLGLAISRRLAELMGGAIGVVSAEGEGSTFWFTARLARQGSSDKYSAIAPDFFSGARVLIVDDNQTARSVLRDYLESWGCRVSETPEGRQAIAILKAAAESFDPFTIALIDLKLPGIDGWQLASEVTADPAINTAHLVLMTPFGHGAQEAKMKLLNWFDAYLTKPVRKIQLFETIFRFQSIGAGITQGGATQKEPAGGSRAREGVRVLVAEDNEVNQHLFLMMLAKMGCTAELAVDGKQAVDKALCMPFDIIFLDVKMPVMDGLEAARALRKNSILAPIIAVTASVSRSSEAQCLEAGMDDFLAKPFRRADIETIFSRWLHVGAGPGGGAGRPAFMESDHVFDYQSAMSAFMGDVETLMQVARAFVSKAWERLPQMESDILNEQWGSLGFNAHAVKGGALGIKAEELAALAARLERAAETRDRKEGDKAFMEYQAALARLEGRMQKSQGGEGAAGREGTAGREVAVEPEGAAGREGTADGKGGGEGASPPGPRPQKEEEHMEKGEKT